MISIQQILCPVDFSDYSRRALAYSLAMAKWYGAGVTALHAYANAPVIDTAPLFPGQPIALRAVDRAELVAALGEFVRSVAGDAPVATAVAEAPDVRDEILAQAAGMHADLIVMGTHGRTGFERVLLGSVAEKVMRKAGCPVMVVPRATAGSGAPADVPFKRIVCAVDFSEDSKRALALALEFAQESDAQLTLVHAIEIPPELHELAASAEVDVPAVRQAAEAECQRRLQAAVPASAFTYCTVQMHVAEGRAHRQILRVASERNADLIVLGVHGRGALDRLVFGSTTHAVLCGATCPVLAVRPQG
jgi:nucleotide-binding universal stress UspA family protein